MRTIRVEDEDVKAEHGALTLCVRHTGGDDRVVDLSPLAEHRGAVAKRMFRLRATLEPSVAPDTANVEAAFAGAAAQ